MAENMGIGPSMPMPGKKKGSLSLDERGNTIDILKERVALLQDQVPGLDVSLSLATSGEVAREPVVIWTIERLGNKPPEAGNSPPHCVGSELVAALRRILGDRAEEHASLLASIRDCPIRAAEI